MWKAVAYQPEDLPEAAAMAREYYGESWVSDPQYLNWQYADNPGGPAFIQLARDEESGRLAGQYVALPTQVSAYGRTLTGALTVNILTRQAYIGQGVFTGLAQAIYRDFPEQGVDFCYGLPNPNSHSKFVQKLEFNDLGRIPLLLRPLDLKALVRRKIGSLLSPLALPLHLYFQIKKQTPANGLPAESGSDRSSAGDHSSAEGNSSAENHSYEVFPLSLAELSWFDAFWLKIQNKYPIIAVRDAAFIRWRYFTNPYRKYQLYGVRPKGGSGSDFTGYIAGRCTEVDGIASGMVVDFLVEPGHAAAGHALLRRLLQDFAGKGMELAGCLMLSHTEESRILKANRFFTCPKSLEPQPFPLIYRRFTSPEKETPEDHGPEHQAARSPESPGRSEDPFLKLKNWFLTMGDYDAV